MLLIFPYFGKKRAPQTSSWVLLIFSRGKKHKHVLVVLNFWKEKSTTNIGFFLWNLSKEEKHRHGFAGSGF